MHTGHIAPYFRGLPPIRGFFGKKCLKMPPKNLKTPYLSKNVQIDH